MKSLSIWQTVNSLSFKKPLIYLVVFCLIFSPSIYIFAQVLPDQNSNGAIDSIINDSVLLVPENNLNLVVPNDYQSIDNANTDKLPLVNGPDAEIKPLDENDPTDKIKPNDPIELDKPESSSINTGSGLNIDGTSGPEYKKDNKPGVDTPTGALSYTYNINVPEGRNGMTPSLGLVYNSQNTKDGSVFGYGWGINIAYIERLNKHGSEKLYDEDYYTSSNSGELVKDSGNKYVSKVENGDFLKYEKINNGWVVSDKQGKKYFYGTSSGARVDDINDTDRVYKWMLERVEDTNGNSIDYVYYKNQGQIYPDNIVYTNGFGVLGIYKIVFQRSNRSDIFDSYSSNFLIRTSYKINEIDIQTNSNLSGKYILSYSVGNNGVRSLLSSIVETKYDKNNISTTLPATSFTYTNNTDPLYDSSSIKNINNLFPKTYANNGLVTGDINGDAYTDVVQAYEWKDYNYSSIKNTYIYNPTNSKFEINTDYTPPNEAIGFTDGYYNKIDRGLRLVDLNGDMKADILKLPYSYSGASPDRENNNGSGWTNVPMTNSNLIYYPSYTGNPWYSVFVQDLNADGFPDTIQDSSYNWNNCGGSCTWHGSYNTKTSLNNGTSFDKFSTIGHSGAGGEPYAYTASFTGDNTYFMMDINGDGLPDFIEASYSYTSCGNCKPTITHNVYINNGSSWALDNSYNLPTDFYYSINNFAGLSTRRIEIADFNYDGLQDILIPGNYLYINQVKNFTTVSLPDNANTFFNGISNCNCVNPYLMMDLDADGDQDFINTTTTNTSSSSNVMYNTLTQPNDVISNISSSSGSSSKIHYKSSATYKDINGNNLNSNTPMIIQTVDSITSNDGLGNTTTNNYTYINGYYYFTNLNDRKFAGFAKVIKTNPDDTTEILYYNQGNTTDTTNGEYDDSFSKIGRIYRTDLLDNQNNLLKQNTTKWMQSQITSLDAYFVYPEQIINRVFNGTNSYDTAEAYNYDTNNGNLLEKTEYGNVVSNGYQTFNNIGNDNKKTEYSYTNCVNPNCRLDGLVSKIILKDNSGNKVSQKNIYYDGLSLGSASLGNNTTESIWSGGSNYQNTNKSYNNRGQVISVTDAKSNTVSISYDFYSMYPASITNSLSQTTNYFYDYNTGKQIRIIDPNGAIVETDYDGFGRPLAERSSSDISYANLINLTKYSYNDIMSGSIVPYTQKTINYSGILSGSSYQLFDGFGRVIREITQTGPSSYIATDTVYDNMGRVYKKSLPYNFTGSLINYFGPTNNSNIITTNNYDGLGRIISSANTLGNTINSYDLNKVTIIDAENHIKDIVSDAYGNITNVYEHNLGNVYNTSYIWDTNSNLLKIIDALGNVRSFTYDSVGNRLSSTDLHDPVDTAYGLYSYEYDKNNNLTKKITPNGDSVTYGYDALNRPINEANNSVNQITYTYDTCNNGVGKLCSVNRSGSSTKNISYTNRGLLLSESTMLGSKNWLNEYIYDYQNNPLQIKYPDNSSVKYIYDNRGLVTNIQRQDNPTSSWKNIISNIVYNSLGQKESVNYANGRNQTYNYDVNKQYQLISNNLDAPSGYIYSNFIKTNYVWSPAGNLLEKTENFNPLNPQKFTYSYDDLSRLTSVTKTVGSPLTGYTENYNYNSIGNLLNKTGAGSYVYNGTSSGNYANPHAVTDLNGRVYSYDKNGNVTGWGVTPNNTALTYNYRNELTSYKKITPPNPVSNTYLYDYSGARIKTIDSSGTTYTPNKYYEEGAIINKGYIYLGNQLVAEVDVSGTSAPVVYYIHPDYLGGIKIVTDASGSLKVEELEYYPFGEILSDSKFGGFDEAHKYTGHEYDPDTNLNFMQARYQYGKEARFFSQDPMFWNLNKDLLLDPQIQNSYSYGRNNPVKYVDPDGNQVILFPAKQIVNSSISNNPNIPNRIREANFLINNPLIGVNVGSAKDGSTKNISSIASNFAVNSIKEEYGYPVGQNGAGTERNAFRHTVWQALISKKYGQDVATNIGNAHEYNPFSDLKNVSFQNLNDADQNVDLLNNQIGRNIYSSNPNLSEAGLAQKSLDFFYTNGLYTVSKNDNNSYSIYQNKITAEQYKSSSAIISGLGNKGLNNKNK